MGGQPARLVPVRDPLAVPRVDSPGRVAPTTTQFRPARGPTESDMEGFPTQGSLSLLSSLSSQSRCRGDVVPHHVGCVDRLPPREGGEQADADVDRAVAEREHPPVAGHRRPDPSRRSSWLSMKRSSERGLA